MSVSRRRRPGRAGWPTLSAMLELAHTAETEVGAPAERVWDAITDPELTRRYVFGCDIEGEWRPGAAWRYHSGGRTAIEGTVLEAAAPHLLRLTARDTWDPTATDEPPYRITWRIDPMPGGRSRVRLVHDGFESQGASYRNSADVDLIVRGLRNVVDPEAIAALRRLDSVGPIEVRPL